MAAPGSERIADVLEELLVELPARLRGGRTRLSESALNVVRGLVDELNLDTCVCDRCDALRLLTMFEICSIAPVICRPPRACSWLERSTCWVMVRIFSALFMMSSEPRACSAVAAAICCTVSAMRPIASVTCFEPFACSTVARAMARTMFVDFCELSRIFLSAR